MKGKEMENQRIKTLKSENKIIDLNLYVLLITLNIKGINATI